MKHTHAHSYIPIRIVIIQTYIQKIKNILLC